MAKISRSNSDLKDCSTPTKRKPKHEDKMSPADAMELADDMDLPDGAYWAVVEELSGCEPADCIDFSED